MGKPKIVEMPAWKVALLNWPQGIEMLFLKVRGYIYVGAFYSPLFHRICIVRGLPKEIKEPVLKHELNHAKHRKFCVAVRAWTFFLITLPMLAWVFAEITFIELAFVLLVPTLLVLMWEEHRAGYGSEIRSAIKKYGKNPRNRHEKSLIQ